MCNEVYNQKPIYGINKGCAAKQSAVKYFTDLLYMYNIIPILKKGDLSKTNNYRDITLTYLVVKIYNLMLLSVSVISVNRA